MADSRTGAGNTQNELEASHSIRKQEVFKLNITMGVCQRDRGVNWKSSEGPKLEQHNHNHNTKCNAVLNYNLN